MRSGGAPSRRRPRAGRRTASRGRATAGSKIRFALFLLVIGVAVSAIAYSQLHDPGEAHYTHAREMVDEFERGKEPANIDCEHPVYQDALAELALVPSDSYYAEPAAQMAAGIQARIDALHRLQDETQRAHRGKVEKSRTRREIMFENQRRASLSPYDVDSDPQCVHDEHHEEPEK